MLHSIGSLDSPSSDPKIPHDPMFCSNLDRRSLTPETAFCPLPNAFSNIVFCSCSDFGFTGPLFNSRTLTSGQPFFPPAVPGCIHFKTLPAILNALLKPASLSFKLKPLKLGIRPNSLLIGERTESKAELIVFVI